MLSIGYGGVVVLGAGCECASEGNSSRYCYMQTVPFHPSYVYFVRFRFVQLFLFTYSERGGSARGFWVKHRGAGVPRAFSLSSFLSFHQTPVVLRFEAALSPINANSRSVRSGLGVRKLRTGSPSGRTIQPHSSLGGCSLVDWGVPP